MAGAYAIAHLHSAAAIAVARFQRAAGRADTGSAFTGTCIAELMVFAGARLFGRLRDAELNAAARAYFLLRSSRSKSRPP